MLDFWKNIAISCGSVIAMMLGFWFVQGKELITRDEVSVMIQKESPYVQDKTHILQTLNRLEVSTVNNHLVQMQTANAINELKVEIAKLRTILEQKDPTK